jgi:hypothetical protein
MILNDYKVLAYIAKEMGRLRSEQEAFVTSGRAGDFSDYRHICGVIRGLNLAEDIINELVQKMEKSDD